MKDYTFTLNEANQFGKDGKIEDWIHAFLCGKGNNKPLSDGLKLQKRYYTGPVLIDIDRLNRCCGPEKDIEYYNPPKEWNERVGRLQDLIKNDWDMPPLIVEHQSGKFTVRDGNGRLEALVREGIKQTWVIIWDNDQEIEIG